MKKVLIISYSQAGQTQRAIEAFAKGLEPHLQCDFKSIQPKETFCFPWKITEFFRAFPRCVCGLAPHIEPLSIQWENYDLVVIGYQVWFLSPSLPTQGFLQSPDALGLKGKKVITLLTCRNLWHSASLRMAQALSGLGTNHLGQITLCETSPLWASFVTTPRWMLTGKKSAFAFFPEAGISNSEFTKLQLTASEIGESWLKIGKIPEENFGSNLDRVSLELMDIIGRRFFRFWAWFILKIAPTTGVWQDFWLLLFRINLIFLIISVGPCTKIFELITGNKKLKRDA